LKGEDKYTTLCRHDLVFAAPEYFGLKFVGPYRQLATEFSPQSVQAAQKLRRQLLEKNPNLLMLAELRYHDVATSQLPEGSAWFERKEGALIAKSENTKYFLLDESNSEMQAQVARQARAVMETGALDGVMLDWWRDDADHLNLVRMVRAAVGDKGLIIVNTNDRPTPDHLHDWYGYWDKSLGKPTARGIHAADGSCRREFDHGTVVYNPLGNRPVTVKFAAPHVRLSTKETATAFTVPPEDGDIFMNSAGGQ